MKEGLYRGSRSVRHKSNLPAVQKFQNVFVRELQQIDKEVREQELNRFKKKAKKRDSSQLQLMDNEDELNLEENFKVPEFFSPPGRP